MTIATQTADETTAPAGEEKRKGPNTIVPLADASPEMGEVLKGADMPNLPRVGDLVTGRVLNISKNGIVVDIDGRLTGLVRGKELDDESGQYSKLSLGEEAEATVLEQENEQGMIELSFRQAGHRKAWDYLQKLLAGGEVVDAKITDANKGGLLVKVGNVEGFLPVSQLTTEHYPRVDGGDKNRILDRLKTYIGETFKVKVITVKEQEEKMIVSEKQAWEKEQNNMLAKYNVGDVVEGKATGVVDFGVFVEFGEGLEGLVHISELAWQRIDDPRNIVRVGDTIHAKVIGIDDGRVSLSVKKLTPDPWDNVGEKYKAGQVVAGEVLKISPYGAFVELDPDIHGLAHISELSKENVEHPSAVLKVGNRYKFKVLSIEPKAHRLGLGLHKEGADADEPVGPKSEPAKSEEPTEPSAEAKPAAAEDQPKE